MWLNTIISAQPNCLAKKCVSFWLNSIVFGDQKIHQKAIKCVKFSPFICFSVFLLLLDKTWRGKKEKREEEKTIIQKKKNDIFMKMVGIEIEKQQKSTEEQKTLLTLSTGNQTWNLKKKIISHFLIYRLNRKKNSKKKKDCVFFVFFELSRV